MGDQRWNRWERRCKEAFLLPVPVPSDSIAGPLKKVKRALASLPPLGSFLPFYPFTFLPLNPP